MPTVVTPLEHRILTVLGRAKEPARTAPLSAGGPQRGLGSPGSRRSCSRAPAPLSPAKQTNTSSMIPDVSWQATQMPQFSSTFHVLSREGLNPDHTLKLPSEIFNNWRRDTVCIKLWFDYAWMRPGMEPSSSKLRSWGWAVSIRLQE